MNSRATAETVVISVNETDDKRKTNGQFDKGNDAARNHVSRAQTRELFQRDAPEARRFLVAILRDETESTKSRLAAAELILAYRYGRPAQRTELTGAEGKDLNFTVVLTTKPEDDGTAP